MSIHHVEGQCDCQIKLFSVYVCVCSHACVRVLFSMSVYECVCATYYTTACLQCKHCGRCGVRDGLPAESLGAPWLPVKHTSMGILAAKQTASSSCRSVCVSLTTQTQTPLLRQCRPHCSMYSSSLLHPKGSAQGTH
jgi:hypothetical protein